ncbi:hypothetical protein [Streptomyces poriticola]|uniref:hypothetical protein n=1 Tax=Streptomyces poriticola TaxID=3120506 RepID=UPI002FCE5BEC
MPETPADTRPAAPRSDRRALRTVLRWTCAALVFLAVGTATAYGITGMERTDVPGLATEPDGRWSYPELTMPPLPSGSPAPFAEGNTAGAHHADLRELLLPAPRGSEPDPALRGEDGWLATEDFAAEYEGERDRERLVQLLEDHGVRHIAARGWTAQDGTRSRVYLLHFDTAAVADEVYSEELTRRRSVQYELRGVDDGAGYDAAFPTDHELYELEINPFVEDRPHGAEQVRHAYVLAGDVLAVIVQSRKGTAPALPFQQTVILQSQLLG